MGPLEETVKIFTQKNSFSKKSTPIINGLMWEGLAGGGTWVEHPFRELMWKARVRVSPERPRELKKSGGRGRWREGNQKEWNLK